MKKWLKIVLWSISVLLVIIGIAICYLYYIYTGKYDIDSEKYQHSIGYLSPTNRDFSENFSRCNDGKPIGYYSSAGRTVYANSKRAFKKNILSQFKQDTYTDTGLLNLRFIINCNGEIGDMEVNELNQEYLPTTFNEQMVEELIQLSVQKEHWKNLGKENAQDVYMYLIYKLKDGEIVEILP